MGESNDSLGREDNIMQQDRQPVRIVDRAGDNPLVQEERSLCRESLARRSLWTLKIDFGWLKGTTK